VAIEQLLKKNKEGIMQKDKGIKVSIEQILDGDALNASSSFWVTPKKATILAGNAGTLVEAEEGGMYLIPVGLWFRSDFCNKCLPQVNEFNKLQDLGLTLIKDKIVRYDEKTEQKEVSDNGQKVRSQNNVSSKKANKTMAPNPESEKKD
jgi:hypothetical protein